MKRERLKKSFAAINFAKAGRKIGAAVIFNEDYGFAGQVRHKDGRVRYFRRAHIDINPLGASEIAKYKCYTNYFLEEMGYPVIEGMTFFSDSFACELGSKRDIDAAYRYAKTLGFPVIVKPNSKGQGEGVAKVYNKRDFFLCMRKALNNDTAALVQRVVPGIDYRIVVLDNKILYAIERRALEVIGDGKSTVRQLLAARQRLVKKERSLQLPLDDYRVLCNLRRRRLSFASVLSKGEKLQLLDNANLSTGGDGRDVSHEVHPGFKQIAIDITRRMGLRLCGVDLMVDGDISASPATYWVIELNASPGMDAFLFSRSRRAKVLQQLYGEVLNAMGNGQRH